MAQRIETGERRRRLSDSLRDAMRDGSMPVGALLPTVRELADKYGLSVFAVSKELQALVDEGILYTMPRVGTFVGQSLAHIARCFLLTTSNVSFVPFIALGFEERIAQFGASSLVLPIEEAIERRRAGMLPKLSGVFDFASNERAALRWPAADEAVPLVRFVDQEGIDPADPDGCADRVYFDEVAGGKQAAAYLMRLGHKRIAYLGLHAKSSSAFYRWSSRRMEGWREAMEQHGYPTNDLLFLPEVEALSLDEEPLAAERAARDLLRREDITAVICANDNAVLGMIETLKNASVPSTSWPAIVGFDNDPGARKHVLTSMRLPWEDVGRAAAQLLWDRASNEQPEPPKFVSIPMRVIARPPVHSHPATAKHRVGDAARTYQAVH